MVWELLCYTYLTLVCGAAGFLALRWGAGREVFRDLCEAGMADVVLIVGLASFSTLLLIWSLFLRLGGWAPHVLGFSVMALGFFLLSQHPRPQQPRVGWRWALIMLAIFPWCAASFAGGLEIPAHYDTFLYHAQTILWNEKFPVVPGLGNLHGRFAFNSSYFLLAAYFGVKVWAGVTLFPLNSYLMLVTTLGAAGRMMRGCLRGDYSRGVMEAAMLAFLYGLEIFGGRENTSSPSPDILAGILVYYGCLVALKAEDDRWRRLSLIATAWISIFAVTVKLSALPLLGLPCLTLLRGGWRVPRSWLILTAIGALILAPWLIRNEILSGYAVYPIQATGWFHVDWKMPEKAIALERVGIVEQALVSEKLAANVAEAATLHVWNWFPHWVRQLPPLRETLVIYVLVAPLFILPAMRRRPDVRWAGELGLLFWAGALFCLSAAPNTTLRFAFGFLITCAALTTWCAVSWLPSRGPCWAAWLACVCVAGWAWFGPEQGGTLLEICSEEMAENPWTPDAQLPRMQTKRMSCVNFEVCVPDPAPGSHHAPDWCGQEPLPCAPYYQARLEMRGRSLRDGFRISPESERAGSKRELANPTKAGS